MSEKSNKMSALYYLKKFETQFGYRFVSFVEAVQEGEDVFRGDLIDGPRNSLMYCSMMVRLDRALFFLEWVSW